MHTTALRVALGQMLVEGGRPERNLDRAVAMIEEAARRQCQVVVLPECLDFGWTHPSAEEQAGPIPGAASQRLCEAAATSGIHVVAGLTERDGPRLFNAAVLIGPAGDILLKHRKINVLVGVEDCYATGDRLGVVHSPLGTIGVNICADNFPDSLALGHSLGRMGAQILLSPCAWAVDADHDNCREPYGRLWRDAYVPLARLFDMPVIGVSNVGRLDSGPWQGRKCIGCSLAVDRRGQVVLQGPYGEEAEELLVVELDLTPRATRGTAIADALRRNGDEAL